MQAFIRPLACAFLSVVILTPFVILIAHKYKVLDQPSPRKIHKVPVPRLGGVAILASFWIAAFFFPQHPLDKKFLAVLFAGTIIAVMGIMDDVRPLSSRIRLAGQLIAAIIVMHSGLLVSFMPKVWWGQIGAVVITLIWIIGIVNALNFADGLDGLASGMTFIASAFFFLLAMYLRQYHVALVAAILAGSCLGFLCYNSKPAKIYLGDGGSTFLGFVLACVALYGGWSENGFIVALGIPTIVLGVLIFDMIYITIARFKNRQVTTLQEWLDYTGKDHFHHRLLSMGFSEVGAVWFVYLVCLILGLNVLVLEKLRNPLGVVVLFANSTLIFLCILMLMRVGRVLNGTKKE